MIYLLAIVSSLCVWLYIYCQCMSLDGLRSFVTWFLAHTACIMHILNYMLHVCLLFFPQSPTKGEQALQCTGAGTRMLYLAAYKTNFSQIYDFWRRVISQNPQTGHNSRLLWCLLCFWIWEAQHCRHVRGVVRRNPLYFLQPDSYLSLSTFTSWKRKRKKPQATFITPSLNYTIIIKQHMFNHSLC